MLHVTIHKVTESCNYIVLSIISDLQFTTSKRAISIRYKLIMDIILMKDSIVINDMLYILQHINLNFIILFHFLLLILSCSKTIVQHLRLDYCEYFELAWKETIDKLKWNMCGFWKYYHVLSKHWQPSCSTYSKCSNVMSWLGEVLFTRVNSFVEALINMVCDLKITSGSEKNLCLYQNLQMNGGTLFLC